MNTVTTGNRSSRLRASDADRDRAIAELSEHFQACLLTVDELEDRTGRALQARTAGELAELFADLPGRPATATGPVPASAPVPAPAPAGSVLPARVPAVPIVLIAVIVLGGFLSGHPALMVLVPVLVFLAIRRLAGGRGGERTAMLARGERPRGRSGPGS